MEKTISYLNSKIWYRLIKVLFLLSFVFFLTLPPIVIFDESAPEINSNKSYLQCENGEVITGQDLKYSGIDYFGSIEYNTDSRIKARYLCILAGLEKEYGSGHNTSNTRIAELKAGAAEYDGDKTYEIVYIKNRNWFDTLGFIFLSIITTCLIFELLRRIFYYIVLGSIKPKK